MPDQDTSTVRRVAWFELFPWLNIFRCFRIAIQVRLMAISALGLLFMLLGWAALGYVFSGDEMVAREVRGDARPSGGDCPWLTVTDLIPNSPGMTPPIRRPPGSPLLGREDSPRWGVVCGWQGPFWNAWEPLWGTWEHLSRPFRRLFDAKMTLARLAFLLLCGLWAAAVWGLFGGAVTRAAAYELATRERLGIGPMLRYARAKWKSYFAAPVIPLLGILLVVIPIALLGILLRWDVSTFLAGLLWPLALLAGLFLAVFAVGLCVGWPLLSGGVSADGGDSFDAIGRAYTYTYQRPLHFLFYVAIAALLGAVGWILVSNFFAAIVGLTYWAASWGGGLEGVTTVATFQGDYTSARGVGSAMIRFWVECVKLLGVGYLFSYFWTAMTAVYLLLRRQVDATEMDEVHLEEEQPPPIPLPPIRTDAAGAPVVDDRKRDEAE